METKLIEHECMTCGAVYWGDDKPQFCPRCNGSMVREVETSDDQLGELMDELEYRVEDFQRESERHGALNEWGALKVARTALRGYVDALVKGGITAQIADLLEQVAALEIVVDAKEQTIAAMQARIDALESDMRELQA